jgi:penicillin-binding protein 1B
LRIFTSMDPLVQRQAERSVMQTLAQIEKNMHMKKPLQAAVVVDDINSGEVLALVGGRDTNFAGFDRALDAARPIGSLVKPAVYLAALQNGAYGLGTPLDDTPLTVMLPNQPPWQPKNYDGKTHEKIPLYEALAHSYNLATARLGIAIGLDKVIDILHKLGVEKDIPAYQSIVLGTTELTPIEVATMYQTLASGGFKTPLRAIRHVLTSEGEPLARYPLQVEQTLDVKSVNILYYAMQAVVREGTAAVTYNTLPATLNIAGKTGTTDDSKDSWFAGFTGDKLAVAWVGRDDNTGTGLTGATGALPVWIELMKSIPLQPFNPVPPEGVQSVWINVNDGLLADEHCYGAKQLPYLTQSIPTVRSPACTDDATGVQQPANSLF